MPTICYGCTKGPDLLRVHVVDGVAVNIEGNAEGPGFEQLSKNRGRLCPKPYGLIQKLYNPYRIKAPLKRTNPEKGRGVDPKWVEISWDEALSIVAEKLREIRVKDSKRLCFDETGPQRGTLYGTTEAFRVAFGATQGFGGGASIRCELAEHTFGNIIHGGNQCEPDLAYCNYLLVLSSNPMASAGVREQQLFADARARGMKMVVVDPVLSLTAAKADEWLPIRPGTDLAFVLALINVIVNELGVYDAQFLKRLTNSPYLVGLDGYFVRDKTTSEVLIWDPVDGKAKAYNDVSIKDSALEETYVVGGAECRPAFQLLKDHVCQYTPEWASAITDIAADTTRRIAREFVDNARIGSTIEIDGVPLPYRPVATRLGRATNGGTMNAYQCVLSNHILAVLVGCLEVPGGHQGGYWHRHRSNFGIVPGTDGMPDADRFTETFTWPPISYDAVETLRPYHNPSHRRAPHLAFRNLFDPPKDFPVPPPPEAYIRYRTNALMSIGEPRVVEEVLKKIPFLVSFAYVEDEVTQLADIVLPEHTELERFELTTYVRSALSKKFWGTLLRQPVVKPVHNTMDIADIFTELADRIGFMDEYNEAINISLSLAGRYKLEPKKKYPWIDIVDRHCKSVTNGTHGLEDFKEKGGILWPATVKDQYDVHLGMTSEKLRYPVPYMEHVKRTGEKLAENLSIVGIDWWPTSDYVALPTYVSSILEEVPPEYDFYVVTCRSMQFSFGGNVEIPWLIEAAEHVAGQTDILMNAAAAASRGIKDRDVIWVESEVGKVKRKVKLCQGIRPDTLLITHQFGNWSTPIARDTGRVSQATLTPIRHRWTDPVVGNMQGLVVKAKVYKA
ncbi:molybdopterin-dependent oxidoreductase [Thermodesulfobacteriota bacterium]